MLAMAGLWWSVKNRIALHTVIADAERERYDPRVVLARTVPAPYLPRPMASTKEAGTQALDIVETFIPSTVTTDASESMYEPD